MNASVNLPGSDCNLTHFRYPLFRTTYILVLVLGLPLNAVALWMFVHRLGLRRSVPVVYMANLALSDLLFTLSLPLRITYFTTGSWTLGDTACMIPGTMFTVNLYSSSFFIMLISMDRMLAVVYPLRSRVLRTVTAAWVACGAVWLAIGALAVPVALNHKASPDEACNVSRCFEHYPEESWRFGFPILCAVTAGGIVLPFSIILACTVAVVRQLRAVVAQSSLSAPSAPGLSGNKMVWLFVSNLLIYAVCFIPFHAAFILYGLFKLNYLGYNFFDVQTVTMCLASSNSCLDPLIYYFSAKSLQKKSKETRDQGSSPTYFSVSMRGLLQ